MELTCTDSLPSSPLASPLLEPPLEQEVSLCCANCSLVIDHKPVTAYASTGFGNKKKTVYEAVQLIFKGQEVSDSEGDTQSIHFCLSCGSILGQVLFHFMDFIRVTSIGSYIYNLRSEKEEDPLKDLGTPSQELLLPSSPTRTVIRIKSLARPAKKDNTVAFKKRKLEKAPLPQILRSNFKQFHVSTLRVERPSTFQAKETNNAEIPTIPEVILGGIEESNWNPSTSLSDLPIQSTSTSVLLDTMHNSLQKLPAQRVVARTKRRANPIFLPPSTPTANQMYKLVGFTYQLPQSEKITTEIPSSITPANVNAPIEEVFLDDDDFPIDNDLVEAAVLASARQLPQAEPESPLLQGDGHGQVLEKKNKSELASSLRRKPTILSKSRKIRERLAVTCVVPKIRPVAKKAKSLEKFQVIEVLSNSDKLDDTATTTIATAGKLSSSFSNPPRQSRRKAREVKLNDISEEIEKVKKKRNLPPDDTPELTALLETTEFKCDDVECLKSSVSFPMLTDWAFHKEKEHGFDVGSDKPRYLQWHPCSQCGKSCKGINTLKKHLKSAHLQLRAYSCDYCDKKFFLADAAKGHMQRVHNNGNPGPPDLSMCDLCGSTFTSKGGLAVHQATHYGNLRKKLKCDSCDEYFTCRSRLKDHCQRAHTEDRPFPCDECQLKFKTKKLLHFHKARHAKKLILDQICEMCGKAFAFKNSLKQHIISFHKLDAEQATTMAKLKLRKVFRILPNGDRVVPIKPVKPSTCDICSRTYVRRLQLFNHYMSVHGKSEEESRAITKFRVK